MFYQTPDMRDVSPDYFLPGELVPVNGDKVVAIKKPSGMYVTILDDGVESENNEVLDREWLLATDNRNVLIADRTSHEGACYAVAIVVQK